jgi:hypothetical protein
MTYNPYTGVYETTLITFDPESEASVAKRSGNYDADYALRNISFTGADAVASLVLPVVGQNGSFTGEGDVVELGELQTLSYSIHRENSPVRILGHVNPRGFIKGGRTIAGSLIFTVFNEYAFYRIAQYRQFLSRKNGFFAPLADMLPPFDIVISFFNEYGQAGKMKIFGVTIIDEGQTLSIDDLIIEQTYTYMARGIQPLVKITTDDMSSTRDPSLDDREFQLRSRISNNVFGDDVVDNLALLYSSNMIDEIIEP